MREIKFRARDMFRGIWLLEELISINGRWETSSDYEDAKIKIMQYTWIKDKNWKDIYEGDILQFSDKRERHKQFWLDKEEVERDHIKYPYERREVILPDGYERLLSNEIQIYREVIWNIYDNPDLINKED